MITVKDWMSKPVITAKPDTTVYDVVKSMNKHGIGCMIISPDGKKIDGIVTERDVLRRVIEEDIKPKETLVKTIMTKKVLTVTSNATLLETSKLMSKNILRRIVVVDNGEIKGIVTSRDLLQLMAG